MNPEDIAKLLDEIGKRVGPAGDHLFDITARQVQLEAWIGIWTVVGLILGVIACLFLAGFMYWNGHRIERNREAKSIADIKAYKVGFNEWTKTNNGFGAYAYQDATGIREPREYDGNHDDLIAAHVYTLIGASLVAFFLFLIAIMTFAANLTSWLTAINNPEWAALQKILENLP